MLFIRSSLFVLASEVVLIFIAILGLLTFYLPLKNRYKIISLWAVFNIWWLGIICGVKLRVIGKENIPDKPCVVISNHQSIWETFAFQTIFGHQTWVLKRELLWIPIFGWGLAMLKPIIINRGEKLKALKKVIQQGKKRIKAGIFVIIFPEGTRKPYGKLGEYQKGGVVIAKKSGTTLLPIYHNAGKFWAKGSFIKYPGTVTITIGKPINPEGQSAAQLTQTIVDWTKIQAKNFAD